MISAGLDSGSQNTKAVILKDRTIAAAVLVPTLFDLDAAAKKALSQALLSAEIREMDLDSVVCTGAGRKQVTFADSEVNEVIAAANAAAYLAPGCHSVLEMGGESSRAVRLKDGGEIKNYVSNDKCASGGGMFIETMARALQLSVSEMGEKALQHKKELPMNAQCVVFSESEVVSLIHQNEESEDIANAVLVGLSGRLKAMAQSAGLSGDVLFLGGAARNAGLAECLKNALGCRIIVPEQPEMAGALGAALQAQDEKESSGNSGHAGREKAANGITLTGRMEEDIVSGKSSEAAEGNGTAESTAKVFFETPREYWRWKEYAWSDPALTWSKDEVLTAGVDIGSTSTQAVLMAGGEKLIAYSSIRTGVSSPESAMLAMNKVLEETGLNLEDIKYTVGTGYGRVNIPFANKSITEITCHARGANYIYGPSVRTILDMGGQDCKAIRCDEKGRVLSFLMNDKCAAGTGRGMEVIADLLAVPVEEIGPLSLKVEEEPKPVSSTCVIFAKAEATNLMRDGWPVEKVLAAYCRAMAIRIARLLERNGMEKEFAITGGIAKNVGVVKRIEELLDVRALTPRYDTQIAGALGAALLAFEQQTKGGRRKRRRENIEK